MLLREDLTGLGLRREDLRGLGLLREDLIGLGLLRDDLKGLGLRLLVTLPGLLPIDLRNEVLGGLPLGLLRRGDLVGLRLAFLQDRTFGGLLLTLLAGLLLLPLLTGLLLILRILCTARRLLLALGLLLTLLCGVALRLLLMLLGLMLILLLIALLGLALRLLGLPGWSSTTSGCLSSLLSDLASLSNSYLSRFPFSLEVLMSSSSSFAESSLPLWLLTVVRSSVFRRSSLCF
uniref:Uncharacterized protein n=1 Tax=Opuntia streptacantha TaxID=393608 RepID=A0A7C9E6B5_OPUST